MTINFQDPRLQRARQKVLSMSPEQAAIFDASAATSTFAQSEAIKDLKLMRIGRQLEDRRRNFNLRNKQRINALDLEKSNYEWSKKQGRIATAISGLGIVPKAYLGYKSSQKDNMTAQEILEAAKKINNMNKAMEE